jgi:hypothetical protein
MPHFAPNLSCITREEPPPPHQTNKTVSCARMMDHATILKGTSYCSTSSPTSPRRSQLMTMINFTSRTGSSIVDPTTPIITKDSEDYANPKSYLKSRRSAAKEKKRAAILDFVDSSVGNLDFSLPDFSELSPRLDTSTTSTTPVRRPSVRTPQTHHHHHKSLPYMTGNKCNC